MFATFRETAASFQNLKYGNQIVKKTGGQALWYWTRYLISFLILAILVGLAALVYYTPQLQKLAADNLPDLSITIKDGKASTNVPQPFVRGDDNFSFIIDTKGKATELDKFKQGIMLTSSQLIAKSDSETRVIDLKDVQNFSGSKQDVVLWLKTHQLNILIFGLVVLIVVSGIGIGFYWLWNVLGFAIWSLLLLVIAKIFKKTISYVDAFKIVSYASVPALLLHVVGFFFPGQMLGLLALAAFLFYAIAWTYNLGLTKK